MRRNSKPISLVHLPVADCTDRAIVPLKVARHWEPVLTLASTSEMESELRSLCQKVRSCYAPEALLTETEALANRLFDMACYGINERALRQQDLARAAIALIREERSRAREMARLGNVLVLILGAFTPWLVITIIGNLPLLHAYRQYILPGAFYLAPIGAIYAAAVQGAKQARGKRQQSKDAIGAPT